MRDSFERAPLLTHVPTNSSLELDTTRADMAVSVVLKTATLATVDFPASQP